MKLSIQGALLAGCTLLGAVSQAGATTTSCNTAATSTSCTALTACAWQTNLNNCVEKITVVKNEPKVPLPVGAITYSNPTETIVDFTIRQNWKNSVISWIIPVYRKPNGLVTCSSGDKVETVKPGKENTYRIQCEPGKEYANVTVLVHDGSFAQLPVPTKANTFGCSGWGTDTGIALYTVNIPCHVVAPTAAPVPPPTSAPVAATPTTVPAPGTPTTVPATQCTNQITVIKNETLVPLPAGTVTYSRPTGMTVDVTITQLWKSSGSISWITPVYRKPSGSVTCAGTDKVETVAFGKSSTYTLTCEDNRQNAILTVLVHDGTFAQLSVPVKTNSYGCSGWGNDMGISEYTLSIPCSACTNPLPPINTTALVPAIEIKKYAGPAGSCNEEGQRLLFDNTYVLPNMTAWWEYCYKIIVPSSSQECVGQMNLTDPAPGGTVGLSVPIPGGSLCPGGSMFYGGGANQGLVDPEGPFSATVVGKGVDSGKIVTDLDPAAVTPDFQPSIKITKYAGPVGKCNVDMNAMSDGTYTAGSDFSFQYCYVIVNNGNECLNAASMVDDELALGGFQTPQAVFGNTKSGMLCPGEKMTLTGPTASTFTGEPLVNATVTGTGEYSGMTVTSADPAAVVISVCPNNMLKKGSEHCPMSTGVVRVNVNGAAKEDDDIDMIYGITTTDGSSIKFKVDNKFLTSMNMFVTYKKPSVSRQGGWSQDCEDQVVPGCNSMATEIEADCLYADGEPYTLIQVYFLDPTKSSPFIFGPAKVDQCCENVPANVPETAVAQYSFILRCECPTPARLRRLEQKSMNVEKILAMFQQ
jgi:hypothetical protein